MCFTCSVDIAPLGQPTRGDARFLKGGSVMARLEYSAKYHPPWARSLCRHGLTLPEIAAEFGIARSTRLHPKGEGACGKVTEGTGETRGGEGERVCYHIESSQRGPLIPRKSGKEFGVDTTVWRSAHRSRRGTPRERGSTRSTKQEAWINKEKSRAYCMEESSTPEISLRNMPVRVKLKCRETVILSVRHSLYLM